MDYKQIRSIIEKDYNEVSQVRVFSKSSPKEFYKIFSRALEELHMAAGPFVNSTEQFIEQIKYKKASVSREVYSAIIEYCKVKLKLDIN